MEAQAGARRSTAGGKQRGGRRTARQWARVIEAQARSIYTVTEFCRRRGIAKATFWYWRRRLAATAEVPVSEAPVAHFLPVPIVAPGAEQVEVRAGTLRVRLEGAAAARLVDALVGAIERGAQR